MKKKESNKNKTTKKDLDLSEEIEDIKLIDQEEVISNFANKLNKDQDKVLEELALIIKGKLNS